MTDKKYQQNIWISKYKNKPVRRIDIRYTHMIVITQRYYISQDQVI